MTLRPKVLGNKKFQDLISEAKEAFKKFYLDAQNSGQIKKDIPFDVFIVLAESIHALSLSNKLIKAYPSPKRRNEILWSIFWDGFGEKI